jgi:integrase
VGREEARLLTHATSRFMHELIIAGIDTGCRPGELLALQWQHVNPTCCHFELPGSLTKTECDRTVPYVPKGRLAGVLAMRRHDPAGQLLPPTAHVFGNEVGEPVKG